MRTQWNCTRRFLQKCGITFISLARSQDELNEQLICSHSKTMEEITHWNTDNCDDDVGLSYASQCQFVQVNRFWQFRNEIKTHESYEILNRRLFTLSEIWISEYVNRYLQTSKFNKNLVSKSWLLKQSSALPSIKRSHYWFKLDAL